MIFVISKNVQKINEGKNGIDFSSNIDYAQKSMAKIMNHRIEKLSTLLNSNKIQLNTTNSNAINEASDNNPNSLTIQVKPLLIQKSKRFVVTSETCNKKCTNSTQLNLHERIHS